MNPASIAAPIHARILARLAEIEAEDGVRILLAVESGSRAWGIASPDSDYDVRFLYVRRIEDYLTLHQRRDVIERPIDADALDMAGWDLRKALALLAKPNPALLEWLVSPIRYRDTAWLSAALDAEAERGDHRAAAHHHYLNLAKGQFDRFIAGRERVILKKYLYSLRPALALAWLAEQPRGRVPMDLPTLPAGVTLTAAVGATLEALLAAKRGGGELGEGARLGVLDDFITARIATAQDGAPPLMPADAQTLDRLDALLRRAVLA